MYVRARVGVSLGVAFIDLQLDCGDVNCYFCTKTHKCVAKKNEHTICVGASGHVFVCMRDLARLECRPEPEQESGGGGEWPGAIFYETSPPYRISITSNDLLLFPPSLPLHPTSFILFPLLTSAPPLSVSAVFLFNFPLVCLLMMSHFCCSCSTATE